MAKVEPGIANLEAVHISEANVLLLEDLAALQPTTQDAIVTAFGVGLPVRGASRPRIAAVGTFPCCTRITAVNTAEAR
jgi:hypothetical protein